MYGLSALGRRRTDGRTDHSIDSNPGLPSRLLCFLSSTFRGCFFNSILYDFVQSLFHIFVTAVKCSHSFLELCFFFLTFSNFKVHFLFGHGKKRWRSSRTPVSNCQRLIFKDKIITIVHSEKECSKIFLFLKKSMRLFEINVNFFFNLIRHSLYKTTCFKDKTISEKVQFLFQEQEKVHCILFVNGL